MPAPTSVLRRIRWPVRGLGLGTPFNLASLSPPHRRALRRTASLSLVYGAVAALLILGLDQGLFAGVSLGRVRAVGALPVTTRILIVLTSAVTEELVYRLLVSTLVASLVFLLLRRVVARAQPIAIWCGILVACVLFGLAHVGTVPTAPHPYLRAITLNGLVALLFGWLYWYRGLESAILAHLAADVAVYLVVASLL